MNLRFWPLAALAISSATSVYAQYPSQDIFKCVDGEVTAYQSMPCATNQTQTRVMTVARPQDAPIPSVAVPSKVLAAVPTAQSSEKMWPPRRTLMLGMSDDEVLNLPGWGVPKEIVRSRASREWKEEWTYPTAAGERKLYFVNARLVDAIVDTQASQQIAIQQAQRRPYPAT